MEAFKLGPHDSLTQTSHPWFFSQDGDSEELKRHMIEFMLKNKGIGLAANQIGITKRVFVMGSYNAPGFPEPFALFNPKILETSNDMVLDQEGCLSYPGLYLSIKRTSWIIAEYQDANANIIEAKFDGYLSKCFQHELDHLNGRCFVDIVSPLKLKLAMKKLRKNK
jgi:peptide deformylase